jgi:hypothetical protein
LKNGNLTSGIEVDKMYFSGSVGNFEDLSFSLHTEKPSNYVSKFKFEVRNKKLITMSFSYPKYTLESRNGILWVAMGCYFIPLLNKYT